MGTDIHMQTEVRHNGEWRVVTNANAPTWVDGMTESRRSRDFYSDRPGSPLAHNDRNYDLFAILANVRNGVGFAAVETGDGFVPLSEPRGIPDDAVELPYSEEHDCGFSRGDHSHSWATLDELLRYDYERTTRKCGVVTPSEFVERDSRGKPPSWCGGVWGAGVEHVSNQRMRDLIARGEARAGTHYTRVEWVESYRSCVGTEWFRFLDALKTLSPDPRNVRIVFSFDS